MPATEVEAAAEKEVKPKKGGRKGAKAKDNGEPVCTNYSNMHAFTYSKARLLKINCKEKFLNFRQSVLHIICF